MNPILATVLTFVIAITFLRLMDFFAHKGWIESRLSRKIIHIGTGPIFVLCWLMFPDIWYSRYLAALVPLLITVQFALVGLGVMKDEAFGQSHVAHRRPARDPARTVVLRYHVRGADHPLLDGKSHRDRGADDDVRRRRRGGCDRTTFQLRQAASQPG